MPVSFLVDKLSPFNAELDEHLTNYDLRRPCLGTDDIAFIGLRDVEPGELDYLKQNKIAYFTMKEVDQLGIEKVLRLALDAISIKDKELHVSFDVDSIDPQIIPSTGRSSPRFVRQQKEINQVTKESNQSEFYFKRNAGNWRSNLSRSLSSGRTNSGHR